MKSKNPADKNAPVVLKDSRILDHLKKGKPGHATKTFHFVKASQMNDASVTLINIWANIGELLGLCKSLAATEGHNVLEFLKNRSDLHHW